MDEQILVQSNNNYLFNDAFNSFINEALNTFFINDYIDIRNIFMRKTQWLTDRDQSQITRTSAVCLHH